MKALLTLGFAGTAKNTGKTTAALQALYIAQQEGRRSALSSIGYDGESRDNVTGLPKPRYHVHQGTLVATAEQCLEAATASYKVIKKTNIPTIFGNVLLLEVTSPGQIILAGPNRRKDMELVKSLFIKFGADLFLIDGALNRIVPMICADALILSTGAAFIESIDALVDHTISLSQLFALPMFSNKLTGTRVIAASLLTEENALDVQAQLTSKIDHLTIQGACNPVILSSLLTQSAEKLTGADLIFSNPLNLIASGKPADWTRAFSQARSLSCSLFYKETLPIRCITINPFYPRYYQRSFSYKPAYVNRDELIQKMKAGIKTIPVIDVLQTSPDEFQNIIFP